MDKISLRIQNSLTELDALLDGNRKRIRQMLYYFMQDTPSALILLRGFLVNRQWKDAAGIVNKIKSGYSYWGVDKLPIDLTQWELQLRESNDNRERSHDLNLMNKLEKLTVEVIELLRKSSYWTTDF